MGDKPIKPMWKNSKREKAKALAENRPVKRSKLFYLNYYLEEHICGGINLAIVFPKRSTTMMAFALDTNDTTKLSQLWETTKTLFRTLEGFRLSPFLYMSGGKGYHIDVLLDATFEVPILIKGVNLVKSKAIENGANPEFFDCCYPSKKAYRIFGSWHYKTGLFTSAFDRNFKILSEVDSWDYFSKLTPSYSNLFEYKIYQLPATEEMTSITDKKNGGKKSTVKNDWSINSLRTIHENGLIAGYSRYNTAFNLGRYFRHSLNLSDEQV